MQRRIPLMALALILLASLPVRAAVTRTIGWQGIVEDGNGIPLQGNHSLTFRLYNDPIAGMLLWEETQSPDLVDGLAEATLGAFQSLDGVDFNQSLWLGLSVDGDTELTPRTLLTAVPYALAVDEAAAVTSLNGLTGDMNLIAGTNVSLVPNGNDITINAVGGGGADGDWNIYGNDLTLGVSGNVGVGQNNPIHKLDLWTPMNVPVSMRLLSGGSWGAVLEQSPESVFSIKNGGSQRLAIVPNGNVGIGTTSPEALLHLDSPVGNNKLLLGTDVDPGMGPNGDLGVSLSPDRLEFSKYTNIAEVGDVFFQGGIYSDDPGWRMYGITGVDNSWDVTGTLSANNYFDLSGTNDVEIRLQDNSTTKWFIANDVSAGDDFVIRAASNSMPAIQIDQANRKSTFGGSVEPALTGVYTLGSSSRRWSVVYAMSVDTPSDRRLKNDIEDLDYGLDDVMALRPVRYQWKQNPELGKQLGLIAQELREVIPEIVHEADDEQKSLSVEYSSLIPVLIAAIQDQQAQIEAQNEEIARQALLLEEIGFQLTGGPDTAMSSVSAASTTGSTH